MIKVPNSKILMKLKSNNQVGDLALVEETHTLYKWDGANWEVQGRTSFDVSLYELNQGIMTKAPEYTQEQIDEAIKLIQDYVNPIEHEYYMLLSNERKYYTLFDVSIPLDAAKVPTILPRVENEVIECLKSLGQIKSIELSDQGTIECWVTIGDNSYVYYFFEYDEGVIKCQ